MPLIVKIDWLRKINRVTNGIFIGNAVYCVLLFILAKKCFCMFMGHGLYRCNETNLELKQVKLWHTPNLHYRLLHILCLGGLDIYP
jgi:hypothetical protein